MSDTVRGDLVRDLPGWRLDERVPAINLRNMVSGTRCAFSLMMTVCAVRMVRTPGRGCDSWITFQMRKERTVEMCVMAGR